MSRRDKTDRCDACHERVRHIRTVTTKEFDQTKAVWLPYDVGARGELLTVNGNPVAHKCSKKEQAS
jgi:hypothetical protein